MIEVLCVGAGGFIGAICRYLFGLALTGNIFGSAFPMTTLLINLIGSFLIGLFSVCVPQWFGGNPRALLFLSTGILGGFTTFSTFSLETVGLFETGEWFLGIAYAVLSVVLCVIGALVGRLIGQVIMPQN